MPAPLDVDREAVKAHAIVHGVREAARAFGLGEDTVCQWSARGEWLKDSGVATVAQQLPKTMRPTVVSSVSKPSEAAKVAMQRLSCKSKLGLAIAVAKGANAAKRMKGEQVIAKAPQLKALADTGDKLHGWSESTNTPTLRLELVAGAVSNQEIPIIDVDADVIPG